MHTERFRQLRRSALSGLLDKKVIANVWRKIVKDQLRTLDVKDLFDNYDFNFNIEERALALKNDILDGTYSVSTPLIYRIEKKLGVCRHLVIPQPADALLLQLLVESVAPQITAKQPSSNAFYSRDKHNVRKPHEAVEYGLSFREQWKNLQKKIYKFSASKQLILVTDLANYFDSINLDELRKVFVSQASANEVVVDLLFKIIEGISWIPDYLPYTRRGLPIANIEAIRLLAHSFLFEIDEVVKKESNDCFVRWMDDITVGIDSRREGIVLLSKVSDMLKSRGLALNLSKTAIYDRDEARFHFQIDQNLYLDSIEKAKPGSAKHKMLRRTIRKRFKAHFESGAPRSWDKIAKRYVTTFGRLGSKALLEDLARIYIEYPGLRTNLLVYLSVVGYSKRSAEVVIEVLQRLETFDDISLFQICDLLTRWEIPRTKAALAHVSEMDKHVTRIGFKGSEASGFHSMLWFKAKYLPADELYQFLKQYQNKWQSSAHLRRQATACMPRLIPLGSKASTLLSQQALCGVTGTVSVANLISSFSMSQTIEPRVRIYVFPTTPQRAYPLSKFMVLCSVLSSPKIRADPQVKSKVIGFVKDPTYRYWLKHEHGAI